MKLEPGFNPADPAKRDLYVYYSPRADFPTTGNAAVVGLQPDQPLHASTSSAPRWCRTPSA